MSLSNAIEGLMSLKKNRYQANATQGNLMGPIGKGMSNLGMTKCSQVNQKTIDKMVKESIN
jgi:hypothetical protein